MNTVADQILSGTRWLVIGRVVTPAITFIISLLTIRLLQPADLGTMALAIAVYSFFAMFEDFGLRARVIQASEISQYQLSSIYGLSILSNIAVAVILISVSPIFSAFYQDDRLKDIILVLAIGLAIGGLSFVPEALLKRRLKFAVTTLIDLGQGIISASVGLAFALTGYGVWALALAMLAGAIFRTLAILLSTSFRLLPRFNLSGARNALAFGGFITGQRLVFWFYTRLDRLLLGRIGGTEALGAFAVASDVANAPADKFGGLIGLATFAGLSRVATEPAKFQQYYLDGVRLISVALFPISFGLAAVLPTLMPLVFGPSWVEAIPIAQVLSIIVPLRLINGTLAESLNALGRSREAFRCVCVTGAVTAAGYTLGLLHGPMGVALGWMCAFPLAFLLNLRLNAGRIGISPRCIIERLIPALAASSAMAIAVFVSGAVAGDIGPQALVLTIQVGLGTVIYPLLIYLVDRRGFDLVLRSIGSKRG